MPNINDINGVTIANLSKLDGVTKANIAKVLGITLEAAAAFLLDTYTGAAAGYSVRRIASSATNLMRIREDSGDTETDIGYDSNGDLDTAAIATHCGTANGFLVSWVDQSGNGNDADQATTTAQPKIYDGTTQAVHTVNGKPAFDTVTGGYMQTASFTMSGTNAVAIVTSLDANTFVINGNAAAYEMLIAQSGSTNTQVDQDVGTPTYYVDGSTKTWTDRADVYTTLSSQRLVFADDADLSNWPGIGMGYNISPSSFPMSMMQEVVIWDTDQTTNRTGIETDINSEYLIYQPTDAPTSGLLATYTGAAAAYSVRQLSDKAVIAITVRRDSDDEEKRFGFDSNGDLDTTGIADFCTTANGYVSQWWDQSTNGNHATQSTAGSQPQIYNGTAVITENGKPAIEFTSDHLHAVYSTTSSEDFPLTTFQVIETATTSGNQTFTSLNKSDNTDPIRSAISLGGNYGYYNRDNDLTVVTSSSAQSAIQALITITDTGTIGNVYYNASQIVTNGSTDIGTTTIDRLSLGAFRENTPSNFLNGHLQEVIVYNSNQSSNRTGIESDINTYFSIY